MKTLFYVFLIFYTFSAGGQTAPKTTKEKFRTIKMQKFPIVDKFETEISVSDIQVLQLVRDSFRLGYSTKGSGQYVVTIKAAKPLTTFLQEHVTKMYKKQYKNDGIKILLVIKELREGEKEAYIPYAYTRLYAYTNLHADAYFSDDGNMFTKIYSLDSVFVNQLGANMASGHSDCIEKALKLVIKRSLLHIDATPVQTADKTSTTQIIASSKLQLDIPILTNEDYKEGAYKNFDEFLNNNPTVTDFEPIVNKKRKVNIINTAKDTLVIWGFCKKGEIYKYYDKALVPIEKQGNGFIISDYVKSKTRRNHNIGSASLISSFSGFGLGPGINLLAGAVGSAINVTAWFREGQPLLVKSYSYIDDTEHQPEATCIDMRTGAFGF